MDLVHFCTVFPATGLTLEVLLIDAEECRVDRVPSRWKGKPYKTVDIRLIECIESFSLTTVDDLIDRLPIANLPQPFDTAQLATALDRPRWFAQKVAYCLRSMDGIKSAGKKGNSQLYQMASHRPRKSKPRVA
jgi:hypothetical protein